MNNAEFPKSGTVTTDKESTESRQHYSHGREVTHPKRGPTRSGMDTDAPSKHSNSRSTYPHQQAFTLPERFLVFSWEFS